MEIMLGGGFLCMYNVIGEVVVFSDVGFILRYCLLFFVCFLWFEGWCLIEGVFWMCGVDS